MSTYLLKCMDCGAEFFTEGERNFYESKGLTMPKRCKPCRNTRRHLFEQTKIEQELEMLLPTLPFKKIKMAEIVLSNPDAALFIIGNGFDLMHGIQSSYYNFRDTIGKSDILRFTLENYIRADDIWGDFENNLAYLDREMMLGTVDDRLGDFGVLDEDDDDFSAADFFAAQETAASPVFILTQDLPKRFRRWIVWNSMAVQNPLKAFLTKMRDISTLTILNFWKQIMKYPGRISFTSTVTEETGI